MADIGVVLVAAGRGLRAGGGRPKQVVEIGGESLEAVELEASAKLFRYLARSLVDDLAGDFASRHCWSVGHGFNPLLDRVADANHARRHRIRCDQTSLRGEEQASPVCIAPKFSAKVSGSPTALRERVRLPVGLERPRTGWQLRRERIGQFKRVVPGVTSCYRYKG